MSQRVYCTAEYHPASDQEADAYCEMYHYVELPDSRPWTALDGNHDPAPRTFHSDRLGTVTIPED